MDHDKSTWKTKQGSRSAHAWCTMDVSDRDRDTIFIFVSYNENFDVFDVDFSWHNFQTVYPSEFSLMTDEWWHVHVVLEVSWQHRYAA